MQTVERPFDQHEGKRCTDQPILTQLQPQHPTVGARLPFRLASGGTADERIPWGGGLDRGESGDEDGGEGEEEDEEERKKEDGRGDEELN
jgi:hypothetical protein